MQNIFNEIKAERERQDKQWGGESYDDSHNMCQWASYIIIFLARTVNYKYPHFASLKAARIAFIKVAALCVAAIESIDRKLK